MNTYFADQIAREHVDTLVADASRARRVRAARAARHNNRAAVLHSSHSSHSELAAAVADSTAGHRPAYRITRPFAAVHAWIASGQL